MCPRQILRRAIDFRFRRSARFWLRSIVDDSTAYAETQSWLGTRLLESLVCLALRIACCPMPHLLHQHHRRVHKCPKLLLRRKHPMWPKLGLPGTAVPGATSAQRRQRGVGSLVRDLTTKPTPKQAGRHGVRWEKVLCIHHPGRHYHVEGSDSLDGLGCGRDRRRRRRAQTLCVHVCAVERAGCQN